MNTQNTEDKDLDKGPQDEPKTDEIKVEVIDDTPPEDRNREPLPKEVKEELDNDSLEEYSEKVKKRISQARKAWHDERRAKEAAERERQQAVEFAQRVYEENKALKQRMGEGEKVFISEVTKAAEIEVNAAKEALRRAHANGDAEELTNAQAALVEAQLKLNERRSFKPSLQEPEKEVQTSPQPQASRVVADPKAAAWRQKNTWFGANKGMTAFALGLHEELVESGVDPHSDEYYETINQTIRKRFPEQFEREKAAEFPDDDVPSSPRRAATSVVAPVTRSNTPQQVRLTASEVALAKKFGITTEQYAREKLKLEKANG